MKTTININGKDVEITLTKEQIDKITKSNQKVTDRIKTFEDALKDQNISEDDFYSSCKELTIDEIAYKKLKLIAKSINEDWTPNWNDSNEYKYYPYFDMRENVGFSVSAFDGWDTFAGVGSRLCFKTKELAEYSGKQFISIYKDFLIIK